VAEWQSGDPLTVPLRDSASCCEFFLSLAVCVRVNILKCGRLTKAWDIVGVGLSPLVTAAAFPNKGICILIIVKFHSRVNWNS
jgi:hypothetical protein